MRRLLLSAMCRAYSRSVRREPGALQQLGEAGDRPQGVREVVRRDGGEAVELLVGDPQLVERVAERQVGLPP